MKEFISTIKSKLFSYPFVITLIVFILCYLNYAPGTWLTGWDNLHPEFNFQLNLYRSFYSVWQEYQGLGLLGGMAHSADLIRQLILFPFSLFIPSHFIRYIFHFVMILTGALGMYYSLDRFFLSEVPPHRKKLISFLGSIFYIFNLGTVQNFYYPFEPFSQFWGLFPWEIFLFLVYLEKPNKRNLLILFAVNLLSTPQAYVQTIFLVYILFLSLASFFVVKLKGKKALAPVVVGFASILLVNSFWILPNAYWTISNRQVTQQALSNKMNTDRFFEENKRRGTVDNFALLREYNFDFQNESNGKSLFSMEAWRDYFKSPIIIFIGYGFFAVILIGIFSKNKFRPVLLSFMGLSGLALLANTPLIDIVNSLIRAVPLVSQIFRNPATKFIVPTIWTFSIGFSLGLAVLLSRINSTRIQKIVIYLFLLALFIYQYPSFRGNFISPQVRVAIPSYYFDLFKYLSKQNKNSRIMNLPQSSYWGWGYYSWGSLGSGFLWYGIEQPILDRAFDVWSTDLENYYWELSHALKSENTDLFSSVLKKYDIAYTLFDSSYTPSDSSKLKFLLKEKEFIEKSGIVRIEQTFGTITLYSVKMSEPLSANMRLNTDLPHIRKGEKEEHKDVASQILNSSYINDNNTPEFTFPFNGLFTNRFQSDQSFKITETDNAFAFSTQIAPGDYIVSPPVTGENERVPVGVSARTDTDDTIIRITKIQPEVKVNDFPVRFTEVSSDLKINNPRRASFIIDVNGTDFFVKNSVSDDFTFLGYSLLSKPGSPNNINIYGSEKKTSYVLPVQSFLDARPCAVTAKKDSQIASQKEHGYILVSARDQSACVPSSINIPIDQPSLIQLNFPYSSSDNKKPQYCIFDEYLNQCINKKDSEDTSSTGDINQYSNFVENSHTGSNLNFSYILENEYGKEKNITKSIRYGEVSITSYPLIETIGFDSKTLTTLSAPVTVSAPKTSSNTTLSMTYPKIISSYSRVDILKDHIYSSENTSENELFTGETNLITKSDVIQLYSKNRILSFWIPFPNLSNDTGYIIRTNTQNKSGLPLVVDISTMKKNERYIYSQLNPSKTLKANYEILPPLSEFDNGVQVLFSNNSFNTTPTINEISDVSLYPLPYNLLTSMYLKAVNHTGEVNAYIPVSGEKMNLSAYQVETNRSGILYLSQSYSPGWVAYAAGRKLEHIRINDWANGWILPASEGGRPQTISIIFWPQYLQFLGFVLLLLTGVSLILYREKSPNHTSLSKDIN